MYLYTLLLFCCLTVAIGERSFLWGLLESIATVTHDTFVPVDGRLNIHQLTKKYGYPLEEHTVMSEDGYIINIHRIPSNKNKKKSIVFLMHGILDSSDAWVLMGPDNALAYVLADQGFDVWMGNARGNKHSQKHTILNTSMIEYWHFTWEEIALYDLPAMIDYILEVTTYDSLYYVGHSQGTTTGYVLCSMKPQYNSKIKVMFSLAPEAWMGHVKSPIVRMFSPASTIWGDLLKHFNVFSAGMDFFNKISAFMCSVMSEKCDNILFSLYGYENKVNETFLPVMLGHTPTGSSMMQFVHYGQLVQSHRFCRYDYGPEVNKMKYGRRTPPDYDLRKVTVPVVLFYSSRDWLSHPLDVEILIRSLPNVNELVYLDDFTHLDYVYASEATDDVYGGIIRKINDFDEYYHEIDFKVSNLQSKSAHK